MAPQNELHHYSQYRDRVELRIMSEVNELQSRIQQLKDSSRHNRDILISAYERMLNRKRAFMQNWEMSDLR